MTMCKGKKNPAHMKAFLKLVAIALVALRHGFPVVDAFVAVVVIPMLLWNKGIKAFF